ncbi:MAG: hypothetical protein JSW26_02935 [Desulfobacterales bacterium]|nr:MAG: hypothetical protein JSW26_02935 [Desulfobacterales bacterium]
MPSQETKRWPVPVTTAFLLVLIASFAPWGKIRYYYSWQFMANLEHPGLCNRILTSDDLSGLKPGAKLNQTGSAWRAGFDIMGVFVPHWLLAVVALFLFAFAMFGYFDYFLINPSILHILSFYGLIHVVASAWGFFSQGAVGWGLILTGLGYLIFLVSFLRRQ